MKKKEKKVKEKKVKEPKIKKQKIKEPKVKKERPKRDIDWSIVMAVFGILLISAFLAWATMIKFEQDKPIDNNIYDGFKDEITNNNQDTNNNANNENNNNNNNPIDIAQRLVIETNTKNYINALESSYLLNQMNDPNYIIPSNEYVTTVNKNLELKKYPDSVNLFVVNGVVERGNMVFDSYTAEYQNGIVTVLE